MLRLVTEESSSGGSESKGKYGHRKAATITATEAQRIHETSCSAVMMI